ncbi:MAG TPA: porin family protein [Chitinophagaceae bacterium]
MRYLTVAVLALLCAGTASSQGQFGVKSGVVINYINTEGNGGTYSDVRAGFTIGASYSMSAAKNFAVQPELNYTTLSSNETISNATIHLAYFQVPVLLKYVTTKQNFSLYAGPQFGFLTKADRKISGGGKTDITKELTETDFAGVFGVEFVTPINITINARYVHGMSNVIKSEFDTFKSRHQYGALTVGYLFRNKK